MSKTVNWTEIIDLAMQFRSAIDGVKYGISPRDRMREFPKGCCDDATDLFAYHLYRRFGMTTTRVDGSYYADDPKDGEEKKLNLKTKTALWNDGKESVIIAKGQ